MKIHAPSKQLFYALLQSLFYFQRHHPRLKRLGTYFLILWKTPVVSLTATTRDAFVHNCKNIKKKNYKGQPFNRKILKYTNIKKN